MSVQSEIDRISANIAGAYSAVADMGGTIPEKQVSGNLAEAVRSIPARSGESAGSGWSRPSNWPDYSKISLDGFEGMYFTYDTSRAAADHTEFCGFSASTQGSAPYTVERGQIVGGAFIQEESFTLKSGETFTEFLTPTESGFVVYRLTSGAAITGIGMKNSAKIDGGERNSYTQPCVEQFGRLPNVTEFSSWRLSHLAAETVRDCKKITSLSNCWNGCSSLSSLDLSGWDTSSVTSLTNCWNSCSSLSSLDLSGWDTSSVTNLANCWRSCVALSSLDLSGWDTSSVTNLANCWNGCSSLSSLDLSGWDTSSVTSLTNCWNGCDSLMHVNFCPFYLSFSLNYSGQLTVSALVDILEKLPVVENTQTVTIGAANKAKLTAEQLAIAAEKNWIVN